MNIDQIIEIANELKSTGINYKPAFVGNTLRIASNAVDDDIQSIVIPNHSGMMAAVLTTTSSGSVVYFFEKYGTDGYKTTNREWISVSELMEMFDEFVLYGCV
jgi:hypothetical protein